ncbi:hypothetical protein SDC9_116894 [bioreactor metagenome]|uniref:Uncharacterized protein n=1 Tax=bioreactor metagenome TaxID=1076179 RepID=A0A645BWP6_9ZZZZ
MLGHPFKQRNEVGVLPVARLARRHRPARSEDGRDVDPHRPHQHPRHDLVAVRDADHRVDRMRHHHRLDGVGDDLTARQRVLHAIVAHGDAVADGHGVEFIRHPAGGADGVADQFADLAEVAVAGNDVGVAVANRDERFLDILGGQSGRPHQRTMRRAFLARLHDVAAHDCTHPFRKIQKKSCSIRPVRRRCRRRGKYLRNSS